MHIWIVNASKGILIQKRADNKESHPGLWDISAAGHIPSGESALSAAVRECEEEVGFSFPEQSFEQVATVRISRYWIY